VSTDTFIRLETIGIKNVRFRKIIFVSMKGVDFNDNGSPNWDFIASQFKVFTDVPADYGHGRIEPE
jgi:arginine/ornithine N-succinyltransferase beta subunit